MKLGIITYHTGLNHGAYLQAFCLATYLKNNFSQQIEVEIVNYKAKKQSKLERNYFFYFKPYFKIWSLRVRLANIIKLIRFLRARKRIKYSPKLEITDTFKTISYDLIIFGSDEIWNIKNPLFPNELLFFGANLNAKHRISYAPSFGETKLSEINSDQISPLLKQFNGISVRDLNSQEIVKKLVNQSPPILPDPTFIENPYEHFNLKLNEKHPFILAYINSIDQNEINLVSNFAKQHKLKIVAVSYYQYWADKNNISAGIGKWLSYFKDASYVITNTYHGVIFSFLNQKPTFILPTQSKANKINGLANQFNFSELLFKKVITLADLESYFSLSQTLFAANHHLIQEEKTKAYYYLKNHVEVSN